MYRWIDHTAEVELEISAASERAVFEDALAALLELLTEGEAGADARRSVQLEAGDRPALLAAWLEELVFLAESEGFLASEVVSFGLADDRLSATLAGALAAPPPLVKAVTYHRLAFEAAGAGYLARVVLDV